MLSIYAPEGESRYLSARVDQRQPADHPVAGAMRRVMQAISVSSRRERVTGETDPERWYRRDWLASLSYDPELPPQQAFDVMADRVPAGFRHGPESRDHSVRLVHSLAKFGGSPVEVEIAFETATDFVRHAKRLGTYWKRLEELFARAFESFVEDEVGRRGGCTRDLVFGTRDEHPGCRGLPYPTGIERERIASALRALVAACAAEGSTSPSGKTLGPERS